MRVANVTVRWAPVLTDGKIDPKKLKPIAFDPVNNTYLAMGDKVGDAFGSGKALK